MKRKNFAGAGINLWLFGFLTVGWLGAGVPLCAIAQVPEKTKANMDSLQKANELKEVEIITLKISRRQTSSTPLQILSGEELQKLNSLSVADAVRFFSGVQLKDYGGIGGLKTINVHSLGSNHTAVFYDGVQIGSAQNGQVDLGKFSLDNIDEIELYNGQKSAIFQSARGFAAASSLYLNSKQPEFKDGRSNNFKAAIKTGSFGLVDPSILWQSKLSDHVYSSVSAEWKYADGKYKFRLRNGVYDTTAVRTDGDVRTMRLEWGLNGILPDSSKWNVKLYGYNDNQGLPGAIVGNVWHFSQRLWNRNFFAQSSYEKSVGNYSLQAVAKYSNDYTKYLNPDIVRSDGLLENRYHNQELYFSVANKLKINSYWDLVFSSDYLRNDLNANLDFFVYPTRNTFLNALATQFHWNRFDVQASLLSTLVYDRVQTGTADKNKSEFTPAILLSWQPFNQKEFRLRTFYKSIFRMPTFNDLYYTAFNFNVLRPEYTKQYDLGFTYIKGYENQLLSQFSIQSDAYYNQVKDKIIAVPSSSQGIWSVRNQGRVEIKGLDVNVQTAWNLGRYLNMTTGIAYTYQEALDNEKGSFTYHNQIPYTPWNNVSFLLSAAYKKFSMNYSYIYTGERYDQTANIPENYVQPFYTHDMAVHYQTVVHKRKIKASVEVNNILNQAYEVVTNYPMPGRSYRFSLTYAY